MLAILAEVCPADQCDPATCPVHGTRARCQKEGMAWLDELSEEAILQFHAYCQLCLGNKILKYLDCFE